MALRYRVRGMPQLVGSFDSVVLAAVTVDVAALVGARIQRVIQPGEDEIALDLHSGGRTVCLLCSIHPRWARIHLADPAPAAGRSPFAQMLRSRLTHARLLSVHQPSFERTLTLRFATDVGSAELIAEIMGRHSNLILVQDGTISGALKPVPPSKSSLRAVLPGRRFVPPPGGRPRPDELTADTFAAILTRAAAPLGSVLSTELLGLSPTLARELAVRAGLDADSRAGDVAIAPLWDALQRLVITVARREFRPVVYLRDGTPVGYAAFPLIHLGNLPSEPARTMSEAVARVTARHGALAELEDYRASLLSTIQAALRKTGRTRDELGRGLAEAEASETLKQRGELLLAYAAQIPAGAEEASVPGYDGQPVAIPLDPTLTPVENARRLFARYAKIRKARPVLTERLRHITEERAYLESVATMAEQAERADLEDLSRELADEGYLKRRAAVRPAPPSKPRAFTLPGGETVLVGRTNQENDRVTFKLAAPDDLWFHTRGTPGAHVILRPAGRRVTERALERAAAIAAYFSKARESGSVAVDYTRRRNVRKPKGARPGAVTYHHEQTIFVKPGNPSA